MKRTRLASSTCSLYQAPCHLGMTDALFQRQMDGCLGRVPIGFYCAVYRILERSPCGILIGKNLLTQQPTLADMTSHDLNFIDEVECYLRPLGHPVYRSLFVEAVMVISVILERNSELSFSEAPVDIKSVIIESLNAFKLDHESQEQQQPREQQACKLPRPALARKLTWPEQDTSPPYDWPYYEKFASTQANIRLGTTSYLARAAIDRLLQGSLNLSRVKRDNCSIC
ncbi:hypothetical protein Ciccas_011739 [Cichlidogyrus casuarinus]|uniref:Phosphorylase b kinase regulatory subunit n=1 Tax=Cichlidogyrus casuarinus TaxID=1844966 RepID=A0ABD2PV90_9PLAT